MFTWLRNLFRFKKKKPIYNDPKKIIHFNFDKMDSVDEYEYRNRYGRSTEEN